ncbi:MAG: YihY/virulence factor BrkB family protein [Lachnospirales bacterium]
MKVNRENELLSLSYELTLKIIISAFPFLMFLVAILGTLNLDTELLSEFLDPHVPDSVAIIFNNFMNSLEPKDTSAGLISTTLIFAIFSASSGFFAVNRGINKTYHIEDTRNYVHRRLVSVMQVLLFTLTIILTLITLIFSDVILKFLENFDILPIDIEILYDSTLNFIVFAIMTLLIMLIYAIATAKPIHFISTLPGTLFTLIFWALSSKCYNIYINNFSKYSSIYGALGTVLIFIFWINIIAFVLLVGCQINAFLYDSKYYDKVSLNFFITSIKNLFKKMFHKK